MRPLATAALVALLVTAGCATFGPSPPPAGQTPGTGVAPLPFGCLGLDEPDCSAVAGAVLAALPPDGPEPVYLQVGPFPCRAAACPRTLAARAPGEVTVELRETGPAVLEVALRDGAIDVRPMADPIVVAVEPTSPRQPGPQARISLGHCGIYSGIDVDGAFWNAVGPVQIDHPDAINAAAAVFVRTGPTTGTLTTEGGLVLQLVRHEGPRSLPLCD